MNPITNRPYSKKYYELKQKLSKLPANSEKAKKLIKNTVETNDISILEMSTGAGKSATVPITIAELYNFRKTIVMSQPRVLTTMTLSKFLAEQLDVELGTYIGYKHGTGEKYSKNTGKIIVVTDAILLLQMFQNIEKYDVVIIDEIHERNVNMDMILVLIKIYMKYCKKQDKKSEVKFILLSATIDWKKFEVYFKNVAKVGHLFIEGRSKPINNIFIENQVNSDNIIKDTINDIIKKSSHGDILIFIPTVSKVLKSVVIYRKLYPDLLIGGLYRGVNKKEEENLLSPNEKRKIIFATNVAETGLTIPGIIYVIETGERNVVKLNQFTGELISSIGYVNRSNAIQRCGRAGRVHPGTCYHLYSRETFDKMKEYEAPEIYQIDLRSLFLRLVLYSTSVAATKYFLEFTIDRIPNAVKQVYWKKIYDDGLISGDTITAYGEYVSQLGLDVDFAILIIYGFLYKVQKYMIPIAVMMNYSRDPKKYFISKNYRKYATRWGDPAAFYLIYQFYINDFHLKNKNKLKYNELLEKWCSDNGFAFLMFKNLIRDLNKLNKKLLFIKPKMKAAITSLVDKDNSDSVLKRINNCFIKTFSRERAIYQPYTRSFYTEIGGHDVPMISPFLDMRAKPSLIGYSRKLIISSNKKKIIALLCVFPTFFFEDLKN